MSSEVNYRQQWAEGEIEAGTLLDAIDELRAQLAAIQGGMGEEPLVVATAILGGLFHGGSGPELGDIDVEVCTPHLEKIQRETVNSSDDVFMPLMTVAQHKRITAAMAAEVERLSRMLNNATNDGIKLADERDALRAELAEVKGQEAVPVAAIYYDDSDADSDLKTKPFALVIGEEGATHHLARRKPGVQGVSLAYASPPASPDVEGLVKALERAAYVMEVMQSDIDTLTSYAGGTGGFGEYAKDIEATQNAISTWRQAQASQQKRVEA